jgi:hypothetical protein
MQLPKNMSWSNFRAGLPKLGLPCFDTCKLTVLLERKASVANYNCWLHPENVKKLLDGIKTKSRLTSLPGFRFMHRRFGNRGALNKEDAYSTGTVAGKVCIQGT